MKSIPFLSLHPQHQQIRTEIQDVMMRVYDGNTFILGEELNKFENNFSRLSQTQFCLGVGNGLDALTMALESLSLSPGDEVIVPAHTYIASWLAVSRVGAVIVPVEPDVTLNIDPAKIENAITKKTKAIMPVHLYGQPCNMDLLGKLAHDHHLLVVEDNAQAVGAKWNNKPTGSFGIANATSFYPTKNLGALGDGGAVTTSDPAKADFIRQFRSYGFARKNVASLPGVNSRLDELQAAVLNIKLKYLNEWTQARKTIAAQYHQGLIGVGDVQLPVCLKDADHVYHLFVIQTNHRDKLQKYLGENGIETMIHYPIPPHLQKAFEHLGYGKGDFPISEQVANTIVSLPLWPGLHVEEVDHIVETIRKFYRRN